MLKIGGDGVAGEEMAVAVLAVLLYIARTEPVVLMGRERREVAMPV